MKTFIIIILTIIVYMNIHIVYNEEYEPIIKNPHKY